MSNGKMKISRKEGFVLVCVAIIILAVVALSVITCKGEKTVIVV